MKIYNIVYRKILTTLDLTVFWLKRKISYRTTGCTSLVCGPELKLLSLYLKLIQPEVKIFGLFCLMFSMKFTLAASNLHYLNMSQPCNLTSRIQIEDYLIKVKIQNNLSFQLVKIVFPIQMLLPVLKTKSELLQFNYAGIQIFIFEN